MLTTTKLLLFIITFIWICWLWSRRKYYYMYFTLKGPWGYPLLGSGLEFLDQTKLLNFMTRMSKEHNRTYFGFLGTRPCFLTTDPVVIEEILTNEKLVDKMDIYKVINDFIYQGLFTSPAKKWYRSRKHINKAFVHKVLVGFYSIFNKQVREFCSVLDNYIGKGDFNLYHYLERVQLDTACLTTMGQETNFLKGDNGELLVSFTELLKITSSRLFNPITANNFVFQNLMPSKKYFDKQHQIFKSNTLSLLEKKFTEIKKAQDNNVNQDPDSSTEDDINITKSKSIFIDIMVREYMAGHFTWDQLESEVNTMILAAYETTTNVLFMSLMFLAMYPEYQEKVYEEIILVTTDDDDVFITPEHVQHLVYTEMIMNETMRLISPVPLVGRNATEDIVLKNGMFIAKDTNIIIDIFNLHRDKDIWGPNADRVFDPDNFLKDNFSKKHPYSFIPFTKGIRNCVGWRYAIISYKIMLAQLIKRYEFSTIYKFEDLVYSEQIVIKFQKNPKLSIKLRQKKNK